MVFSVPACPLSGAKAPESDYMIVEQQDKPLSSSTISIGGAASAFRRIEAPNSNCNLNRLIDSVISAGSKSTTDDVTVLRNTSGAQRSLQASPRVANDLDQVIQPELECAVCKDRASGFHYGVFACEGCKASSNFPFGFFRRSVKGKVVFRSCSQDQECVISRATRNRCQFCRLKRCINVGMSRDAVRFGRVPKREKARLISEMQILSTVDGRMIFGDLDQQIEVIELCVQQYRIYVQNLIDIVNYQTIPEASACPYSSMSYSSVLAAAVSFASALPGFRNFALNDRIKLLKVSLFPTVVLAMLSPHFMSSTAVCSVIYNNGCWEQPDSGRLSALLSAFIRDFSTFALNDEHLALLCMIILCSTETVADLQVAAQPQLVRGRFRLFLSKLLRDTQMVVTIEMLLRALDDLRQLQECHNQILESVQIPSSMFESTSKVPNHHIAKTFTASLAAAAFTSEFNKSAGSTLHPNQLTFLEQHRVIASLLEQPSKCVLRPDQLELKDQVLNSAVSSSTVVADVPDDDEQPLNLCMKPERMFQ